LGSLELRLADGERIVGNKIGVTSKPVQDMSNVRQPDFGFLTNAMQVDDGSEIVIADSLIQPRAEAEIELVLKEDLHGPVVSAQQVLEATEFIAPCFVIVDSRIDDWKIKIADTVADNASCGAFALGSVRASPHDFDLVALQVTVSKNGQFLSEGVGAAVQGSPLASIAWFANTMGSYGVTLSRGDIFLSGSLVPLEPTQSISSTFLRLVPPETMRTRRFAMPSCCAMNSINARLAAFSTAGAATRILIIPSWMPPSSVLEARGCMWTSRRMDGI
jgi:2-oxopent-4-enoate/cis-2-oxohex-4-enoate hydratase